MNIITIKEARDRLYKLQRKQAAYDHAMGLIYYDGSTTAPKDTADNRAASLSVLSEELYKLGMGLYYQGRILLGTEAEAVNSFHFRNEMVFSEAGSYLKFFPEIADTDTRGYILRALANISIAARDVRRRIAVSGRVLQIVQDPYYRSLAPELPWDTFLRRTHQQMSSCRHVLSRGNLSADELALVLESCQEVFRPEDEASNPNIRWLWPYYEMEYSCGFVDLPTTLQRLERLINRSAWDQYDVSGLYGNVQLTIYYGRLLRDNPSLPKREKYLAFLSAAYRKMMKTLLSCPTDRVDDFFRYLLCLVITDYFETPEVPSYREITARLMQRFTGGLYIRSRRAGELMAVLCRAVFRSDPGFFDDVPFLRAIADPGEKEAALLDYARQCGLYHDFGRIKMDLERIQQTRQLFEGEYRLHALHTVSGHDDLMRRPSTAVYADVALGHHRWYNGAGGYPECYERMNSPYRQITDVMAVVSFLNEEEGEPEELLRRAAEQEDRRFSPLVAAYLSDPAVVREISRILRGDGREFYLSMFRQLAPETAIKEAQP